MNEGSLPPQNVPSIQAKSDIYERRDGQWVKKVYIESERKSVNTALRMPVPPLGCKHEWGPHKGPIPCIAYTPPRFFYQCTLCNTQTSSCVNIPIVYPIKEKGTCEHTFSADKSLGARYAKYQACTKCGEQKLTE